MNDTPHSSDAEQTEAGALGSMPNETKVCPRCAETVRAAATTCRFCGYQFAELTPVKKGALAGISKATWLIAASVLVVGGLIVGAVIWAANQSKTSDEPLPRQTYTIDGSLSAPECGGGYSITYAAVEVRDQSDKLIGSSSTGGNNASGGCEVSFEVEVPKASFYQITIGTHGGPSYSFNEMEQNDWVVELSL